jgi:hypothetical protein
LTDANRAFCLLRNQPDAPSHISITLAPEPLPSSRERDAMRRELDTAISSSPTLDDSDDALRITPETLRAIHALHSSNPEASDDITNDEIELLISALQSKAITPAERALGHFTRRKLKTLDTWPQWEAGEHKQLNQFHDLGMFGSPCSLPSGAILLNSHWQYRIKLSGKRRSRNCCDGSPRAAPRLHALAETYASCVEQPIF